MAATCATSLTRKNSRVDIRFVAAVEASCEWGDVRGDDDLAERVQIAALPDPMRPLLLLGMSYLSGIWGIGLACGIFAAARLAACTPFRVTTSGRKTTCGD